jgi:hypothetical protein
LHCNAQCGTRYVCFCMFTWTCRHVKARITPSMAIPVNVVRCYMHCRYFWSAIFSPEALKPQQTLYCTVSRQSRITLLIPIRIVFYQEHPLTTATPCHGGFAARASPDDRGANALSQKLSDRSNNDAFEIIISMFLLQSHRSGSTERIAVRTATRSTIRYVPLHSYLD